MILGLRIEHFGDLQNIKLVPLLHRQATITQWILFLGGWARLVWAKHGHLREWSYKLPNLISSSNKTEKGGKGRRELERNFLLES